MSLSCQSISKVIKPLFEMGRSSEIEQLFQAFLPHPAVVTDGDNAVPFLQTLQQAGCKLDDADRRDLLNAAQVIEASLQRCSQPVDGDDDPQQAIQNAFQLQHPDEQQRRQLIVQLHHRLLGLLYGVLTASSLPQKETVDQSGQNDNWVTWLNLCGTHWDAAWWFPLEDSLNGWLAGIGQAELGRVDSALTHASNENWLLRDSHNNWSMHGTTWLTVRRLLFFLLSESESQATRDQLLPVLWVRRSNDPQHDEESTGVVRGLSLQLRGENQSGWYFDPVTFGITVFDDDMQQSIEIAGRLSWPSLKDTAIGAIRLTPSNLPKITSAGARTLVLSGNSAGGLVGCGVYGLSQAVGLTEGLTASVALRLRSGVELTAGLCHITEQDVECIGVAGATSKLISAADAGLHGVAIHERNKNEAECFRTTTQGTKCVPEITNSFSGLYKYLTHGFRVNLAVKDHADGVLDDWREARGGGALDGERHHLDVFVKPRISVLKGNYVGQQRNERWKSLPPGVKRLIDRYLIPSDRWLVITEDAGGGKTVLSWYLMAALSRHRNRFWVVRYEGSFPKNLRCDLEAQLSQRLKQRDVERSASYVLDDLLQQGRVVVIYDALDQDNSDRAAERIHQLRHDQSDKMLAKKLRFVVTSRPYAVNQQHTRIFGRDEWRHCRLELFNEPQQNDYPRQVVHLWDKKHDWGSQAEQLYSQVIPDRKAVSDLMAYPVVQWLIRTIVVASLVDSSSVNLRAFRNVGDLYWEVTHRLLSRAFKSGRFAQQPGDIPLLFEAIACYGYELMLRYRDSRVPSADIPIVKRSVSARFSGTDAEWDRCSRILRETYLTEHLLLKENSEQELSFPSVKMTEFFAGVYLGRYCTDTVTPELSAHIGDEKWNNVWQFVAELPETTDQEGQSASFPDALTHSLLALFSVPKAKTRPTESMFRAWQVLTRNEWLVDVKHHLLRAYRHQFRNNLIEMDERGEPAMPARTAAEVLHQDDLLKSVTEAVSREMEVIDTRLQELESVKRKNHQQTLELTHLHQRYVTLRDLAVKKWCDRIRPKFRTFALCSDEKKSGSTERLTFMMGAYFYDKHASKNEKPWQPVDTQAFFMGTACITRGQYRLFDSQRSPAHSGSSSRDRAPEDDHPMTEVDFFDGFCFALIVGDAYSLPSECEWEAAAWGGIDRRIYSNYVIGVPPFKATFTSQQVNFNGNYPLKGAESDFLERPVAVRHNRLRPNNFGLWQMHGNVWEWCRSEWWDDLKAAVDHRNDDVATGSATSNRCVRGGSYIDTGRDCRASHRFSYKNRYTNSSFRLSRTM